ncbi:hypothetical protein [Aristaeella lactis]|uniref:hypothetical protein n=1 Tax=Aristaeella lactis TaxID=3046383 RepID=UPI00117D544E|nr:hypothetical protein [Aristaeella lactis]QUA52934.1 hypothetical protein JYE50_14790 [Aristaeella lactis]
MSSIVYKKNEKYFKMPVVSVQNPGFTMITGIRLFFFQTDGWYNNSKQEKGERYEFRGDGFFSGDH